MRESYDPRKVVHRIKLKHEAVVNAAITAINCYRWQGEQEQQARFLAEAMRELEEKVVALGYTRDGSYYEDAEPRAGNPGVE